MEVQKIDFMEDSLIPRLISEFGYPKMGAQLIAKKLVACSLEIKTEFWNWWQTGLLKNTLSIEGYTVPKLMTEHGMKPIAAFLTLDWLIREPEAAKASLKRGHDRIITKSV